MKITLTEVPVRDLVAGFVDNNEAGVFGYSGKLNIRPPYQREFVYKDKQREAVIDTLTQGFPLNVMYWAANEDGTYEIIDGQQRTISICQYITNLFPFDMRYFYNLRQDEKEQVLDYKLQIYICNGTESEKLKWFRTINIAGEELTDQELRNAVYAGSWVSDAKKYFSKTGCPAYSIASKYLKGTSIRQEYLETALKWKAREVGIEIYMGNHQHDASAIELWNYFRSVIDWVEAIFPTYRKEMKGVDWGWLYDNFHTQNLDAKALEERISTLMQDSDVKSKSGIYPYVLDGNERHLDIRAFDDNTKREVYEKQKGVCPHCGKHFELKEMEADHITPWCQGGRTVAANCQMLCRDCNRRKSGK